MSLYIGYTIYIINIIFMKKQIVIFSVLMSLVLLASCSQEEKEEAAQVVSSQVAVETSTPVDESLLAVEETQTVLAANYEEYNEASLGEAESTVLFFHAPYCGSCTQTDKNLKESGVADGTKVLKLDYDTNQELAKEYGVVKYHTFVQVDADGNKIKSWGGSLTDEDIQNELDSGEVIMKSDDEKMMDKSESEDTMMKDEEVMEESVDEEVMMEKDESEEASVVTTVETAGTYADYDASLIGQSDTTVLAFFAAWCPSCVAADKGISGGTVPDGLSILKADFDSETDLRKKYGVTSQHTYVQVDADGNLIKKWVGGTTVEEVVEKVQ